MSIPGSAIPLLLAKSDDAYRIEKSFRFVEGDTPYLNRTPSSSTTNQKQFTFSFWAKPTSSSGNRSFFACGSSSQVTGMFQMWLESGRFIIYSYGSGYYRTDAYYRDPSAFYHFVVAVDSNLATTSDIWKLWVNGVRVTDWYTETDPAQNNSWIVNTTTNHEISGIRNSGGTLGNYWDGYLAEYYLIDGQALTAADFGETNEATGQWVPKEYTGTYGTNGFYLKFGDIEEQPQMAKTATGKFWTQYKGTYTNDAQANAKTGATYRIKAGDIFTGLDDADTYSSGDLLGVHKFNSQIWRFASLTSTDGAYTGGFSNGSQTISSWKINHFDSGTTGWEDKYVSCMYYDGYNADGTDYIVAQPDLASDSSGNGNDWTVNNLSISGGQIFSDGADSTTMYSYWPNAFDGGTSTGAFTYITVKATCTIPTPVTWSTSFEVSALRYGGVIEVNDTDCTSLITGGATQAWYNLNSIVGSSGTFEKIAISDVGSNYVKLFAVRLDGVILTNSTLTACVLTDSPTTNYCTLNPLDALSTTITNGNLQLSGSASTAGVTGTIGVVSGKYYWELTAGSSVDIAGVWPSSSGITGFPGSNSDSYGYFGDGQSLNLGTGYSYGTAFSSGSVIGVALDLDNGTIKFYNNGTDQGVAFTGLSGVYRPAFRAGRSGNWSTATVNFGQRAFAYTNAGVDRPAADYLALNTLNLPDPVIDDPSKHFDIVAWTATNINPRTITTPDGWTPDLVWHKMRSNSGSHYLWDKVRGFGNNGLIVNSSAVEGDQNSYYTMADATNGFSIQQNSPGDEVNKNGRTYVSWMWNAGGSNTSKTVGSENSNAYNTSQTWSSNLSVNTGTVTDATKAFDGSIVYADNATSSSSSGSDDRSITATLGITLNNDYVEVYPKETYSGYYATIDGVAQTTQYFTTPNGWKRMGPFTGTLTSVTVTNGTETSYRGAGIRAIKVADKILIDDGVTPVTDFPSIASTVRASTTAGFSIVSYTGNNTNPSTVAHGLNAKPAMIWVKDREQVKDWVVYHKDIGATKLMYLNTDSDVSTVAYGWDDTEPTSSVWSMQDFSNMNSNDKDYLALCWSEVEGYSKFGSYTGNASATEGPFVFCGFTPRWLLLKQAHSGYNGSWVIYDTARTPTNSGENWLYANSTAVEAEAASYAATVTSNGFKMRSTSAENNGTDRNYIFAAFAETPFKYSNAR